MSEELTGYLHERRDEAYSLLRRLAGAGKPLLLASELCDLLDGHCAESGQPELATTPLGEALRATQLAVVDSPWISLGLRRPIGHWRYLRLHMETMHVEELSVAGFLELQERIAAGGEPDPWGLQIDLRPFNREFPRLQEVRSVGHGVDFLNRRLSSQLFVDLDSGDQRLLDFLRVHSLRGRQLMLNGSIKDVAGLRTALRRAETQLRTRAQDAGWDAVGEELHKLGFEPGWGRTVARMRDTLRLLSDILEAPSPARVEEFLARLPMISSIVILSPHGYFGQAGVLGLPDTGGQVVYILDQARALEHEMSVRMREQGLDIEPRILIVTRLIPEAPGTTCGQRWERVAGTEHAAILRVPFRDEEGRVVPQWISRFAIWPYLERFAAEVEKEILTELGDRPALIVGNYSDGNLVASLLSRRLGVTQCNIAHALEKSKYLFSDLYWRDNDAHYHFSCQFTADLIAMNAADFIITSTYQEIRGTEESIGQYESYGAFTMPGLYRVVSGIDVFDPKFNVVSPGADPEIYFPWSDTERRLTGLSAQLDALVYGDGGGTPTRGSLADPDKPLLFTMARLDRIKNLTGLVDWYGSCPRLREAANLLVIGGYVSPDDSKDAEEREQIERMHALIDQHDLEGNLRWAEFQTERTLVGELYRYVADRRGMFVQPALFEAYGLTVIESMSSGLPVCATCYGGPSEILEHGVSGYHIDPNHGDQAAQLMAELFERFASDPRAWEELSQATLERVRSGYTWDLYARRMMTLARVYGFWKYVTDLERSETQRYLETLYSLLYRPLAAAVPTGDA
jgi:sucrose synthase